MANGEVQVVDKTGQPRSEENLEEALQVVEHAIVKQMMQIPPRLFLQLPIIREAVIELLERRKKDG